MQNTPQTDKNTDRHDLLPTGAQDVLDFLQRLEINYELFHHAPIFTVAEGVHLKAEIPGIHCRNLFLRDKKKNTFLIVVANETEIDLRKLPELIGAQGRLSFGSPERLWEYLGIRPGSVNPFTVMNDPDNKVVMILDQSMMQADIVNYHPNDNAMTIGLRPADLIKFLEAIGHCYTVTDLGPAAP